ncbi:hypothetical protein [Dyadobacter sp. CY312]|uniref:hypothetical protein n=1 Tax=Dyadobacter sp. CY312 TaxID=2907303 RepID=UPI001F2F656D|nr:hypothetical protein [Dyadobacter sp. CY312]MCE7040867.1 hypothetical protein [Dyadobacter sp. CY312]
MKIKALLLGILMAIQVTSGFSQIISTNPAHNNKGKIFVSWGWNRAAYTKSDISFKGEEYNFKLKSVIAKDRQTPFTMRYFNPTKMTIPQYNFRIGYFFNPKYSISFGFDHMKYVMQQDQTVKISGTIAGNNAIHDGVYDNDPIQLTNDFLQLEHTNGLNYLNLEIRRMDNILDQRVLRIKNIDVNFVEGIGAGLMYPKSDVKLMNYDRNDQWHVAGYGVNLIAGLNFTFFKHFFIQGEVKGGYINMPDILTTNFEGDRASQHFFFAQANANAGVIFKF